MTTTTNPGNYVDFDEYVGLKLEKTRSTIRMTDLLTALAGVAAMFLGYLLVFVVFDQWIVRDGFGPAWRWVLLSTLMVSTVAWLVWKVGIPSFRTVNSLFAARQIEDAEPELKSNLLNLIDLKGAGRAVNPAILKAMERRAAIRLQQLDVATAIDHRPLIRTAYVLLTVIVLFCLYALFSPKKITNSIWRGLLPSASVPIATRTEILSVTPGDVTIPAHTQSVEIQVDLGGEIPRQVWVVYTTADGRFDRQPVELRVDETGPARFRGQLVAETVQGLMQDLTYFIRAGDAESAEFRITVEQPPSADLETVRIEFPPYMKLAPIEQSHNGQIDAWEGARVEVVARTNMPVRMGVVQFLDDPAAGPTGEEYSMTVSNGGRQLQAEWTLGIRSDGTTPHFYRIDCKTEDGRRDTAPTSHSLTIRPDLPPEVTLLQPERDLEAAANATIPLLIQAQDPDFELGYLYLNVEKSGQKILHEQISEGRKPRLTVKHLVSLAKLNAAKGEEIDLWIEAFDNKQPRPNTRNTPRLKIRIQDPVTRKQAEQQLADDNQRIEQMLEEAERDANESARDSAEQADDDTNDRDRPKKDDVDQREAKPGEQERDESQQNPSQDRQRNGNDGKGTQPAQQTSKESGNKDQPGTGRPDEGSQDPSQEGTQNDSKPRKPLNSDGSDDDEAIRRLAEQLERKPKDSDENPQSNDSTDSSDDPSSQENSDENRQPASDESIDDPHGNEGDNAAKGTESKNSPQRPDEANPSAKDENKTDKDPLKKQEAREEPKKNLEPQDESGHEPQPKPNLKQNGQQRKTDPGAGTKDQTRPENPESHSEAKGTDQTSDDAQTDDVDRQDKPPRKQPKPGQTDPGKTGKTEKPSEESSETSESSSESDANSESSSDPSDDQKPDQTPASKRSKEASPPPAQAEQQPESKTESSSDESTDESDSQPSRESPNAVKKRADGSEKGPAKPDRDPQSKPDSVNADQVHRDPKDKPETRRSQAKNERTSKDKENQQTGTPNEQKSPPDKLPTDPGKPSETNESESADDRQPPQNADPSENQTPSPKGMNQNTQPAQQQKQQAKPGKNGKAQDASRPQGPSESSESDPSDSASEADSKPSDGDGGGGQPKSKKNKPKSRSPESKSDAGAEPDTDGQSENDSADGSSSQNQSGGDAQSRDQDSAENESEQPDQSQTGSEKKKESNQPGKKSGDQKSAGKKGEKGDQSAQGQSGKGKGEGDKAGKGDSSGKPSSQSSSTTPGKPGGALDGAGGAIGQGDTTVQPGGDGAVFEAGDDVNLEYNRQATELVLQKLQKDLERGEIDPEILEQLGWNETEIRQFTERISHQLSESKRPDESPESLARQQQFDEMLRNLNLQKSGSRRTGESEPQRDVIQIESKRTPVPSAYRSAYEKFTRDMARQKAATKK